MRTLAELERDIVAAGSAPALLALAEEALGAWVVAALREEPTREAREGFRLLALHHQGTRGIPSFNACRETCREIAYHHNLLASIPAEAGARPLEMMRLLVRHVACFVHGKMETERLGEFCCASRPLRADSDMIAP